MKSKRRIASIAAATMLFNFAPPSYQGGIPQFAPTEANAIGLCSSQTGYLIHCCPRPCPVRDLSKYAQVAQQVIEEKNKVTQYVVQAQQWLATLQTIGQSISGLQSLISGVGSGSMASITNFTSASLPSSLNSMNMSSIPDMRTKISDLFLNPNTSNTTSGKQQQQLFIDEANITGLATALNAMQAIGQNGDKLKSLAAGVSKASSLREDFAASSSLKIALLQALQDQQKLTSTSTQMIGLSTLFNFGTDKEASGDNYSSR
jgi:hypothetical protein